MYAQKVSKPWFIEVMVDYVKKKPEFMVWFNCSQVQDIVYYWWYQYVSNGNLHSTMWYLMAFVQDNYFFGQWNRIKWCFPVIMTFLGGYLTLTLSISFCTNIERYWSHGSFALFMVPLHSNFFLKKFFFKENLMNFNTVYNTKFIAIKILGFADLK